MVIERTPLHGKKTSGRWANYLLVIDEISVGEVRGTWSVGSDKLLGRKQTRAVAFAAGGKLLSSIREAEIHLVGRQLTLLNPSLPEPVAREALAFLSF